VRTVSRNFKIILVVIIAFIFHSCGKILDDIENAKVDFVTELGLHVADIVLFIDETSI
jgi:hypothetical protein